MKRIIAVAVLALCTGCLFSCSESEAPPEEVHVCEYGEWETAVDPTCTDVGQKIRYCGCGSQQTVEIPRAAHKPITVEGLAPDCENDGYTESSYCEFCYEELTKSTPVYATGHDYKGGEIKSPTCIEDGHVSEIKCSICGDVEKSEALIPATGHNYRTKTVSPTCDSMGYDVHACIACSDTYEDNYTNKLNHNVVRVEAVLPTCTTPGYTEGSYCSLCSAVILEQTPVNATGHTEKKIDAVSPDCNTVGHTEGIVCSICDTVIKPSSEIPKLTHKYNSTVIPATCRSEGYTEYKCSLCDHTYSDTYTEKLEHVETVIAGTPASCVEPGMTNGKYCIVCNTVTLEQVVIVAKGHTEVSVIGRLPTCTEGGITESVSCSDCGEVLLKDVISAPLGHEYSQKITAPTCTEGGHTDHTCVRCGDSYRDSFVEKKGHSVKTLPYVAPTCTNSGSTEGTYCTDCGMSFTVSTTIPAVGHTERVLSPVAPTCSENGLTEGADCAVCGTVLKKQNVVAKLVHSHSSKAILPTCTEGGYTLHTCSLCGYSYKDDATAPLGHVEHTVKGIEATCTASGLSDGKKCMRCDAVLLEQSFISAKGHTTVIIPSVPATCTKSGMTEGAYCSDCSATIITCTEVAAKGHTERTISAVAATCYTNGSTEGKVCSVCDVVLIASEVVLSTGHNYVVSVIPATCTEQGYTVEECVCGIRRKNNFVSASGHAMTDWHFDEKIGRGITSCEKCDYFYGVSSMRAEYVGQYHPFVGEYVAQYMLSVEAIYENGTNFAVRNYEILDACLDTPGTDTVTVKFFEHEVKVSIPVLYAPLPGTTSVGYFTYTEKGGEYTITGYTGAFTDVVIPALIERKPVTAIAANAFKGKTNITSVEIPGSVKTIGNYAFRDCSSLTDVTLHEGITTINYGAFMNSAVKEIVIPNSMTEMKSAYSSSNYGAFEGCLSLTKVTIGNSLTTITPQTFNGCKALKTVIIGDGTAVIDSEAFYGCTALTDIKFGNSITDINEGAFSGCTALSYVDFPSSLVSIGKNAFLGCSSLCDINFNEGLTTINNYAFKNCVAIEEITFPSTLKTISEYAFQNCDGMVTLNLNDGLKTISCGAFMDCDGLKTLIIPNSVTVISSLNSPYYYGAFEGCDLLYEVIIGNSLSAITPYTFSRCTSLRKVKIGDSCSSVQENAFESCTSLEELVFGNSVNDIGNSAFSGCTSLQSLVFPSSLTTIFSSAFSGCTSLTAVEFNEGIAEISSQAFENCTAIESLSLPSSLQSIGHRAFAHCEGLKRLNISEGLKTIDYGAFSGCTALTSVTIPDSVTAINSIIVTTYLGAFSDCTALKTVKIGGALAKVSNSTFEGCTALETVILGANCTIIDNYAFSDCVSLADIDFGGNLRTIGKYAFQNCCALEKVYLPSTVQSISEYAFNGCTSLEIIHMPSIQTIGNYAFRDCKSLDTVTISGARLASVGSGAFLNCTQLKRIYYGGDAEKWAEVEIAEKNSYPLDVTPYYYSENEPTTVGNYWHYASDNTEIVWNVSDKQYLADHYTREYATEICGPQKSYISQYMQELLTVDFVAKVTLWETAHIISSPSHTFEGGYISRENFYKMAIFETIGISDNGMPLLYELITDETLATKKEILDYLEQKNIEDIYGKDSEEAKAALKENPLLKDISDVIDACFTICENAEEAFDCIAKYKALTIVRDEFGDILSAIAADEEIDKDIRAAAEDIVAIMNTTCEEAMTKIIKGELLGNTTEDFALQCLDWVWGFIWQQIPGIGAIDLAIKGLRAFGNTYLGGDEEVQNYIMMDVMLHLQGAIRKTIVDGISDPLRYENSSYDEYMIKAANMLEKALLQGYDYAYDFAVSHGDLQRAHDIESEKMIYGSELEEYRNNANSDYYKYYGL